MLLSALLVDAWLSARAAGGTNHVLAVLARRVDDLAYGAGLWSGSLKARDAACLFVRGSSRAVRRSR
jgi:hypothetical protein